VSERIAATAGGPGFAMAEAMAMAGCRIMLNGIEPAAAIEPERAARSVTDLLVFLCGPAARDMTGALLPVEGGWLAS
jgi:NAD(P)-dependent dehydrogenase (short-subunit alcohol dehydrogenase family)